MAYFVIEGPDGAGKTLQSKRLVERLESSGFKAAYLTEPSKKPLSIGAYIRHRLAEGPRLEPWEAIGLFVADRRQQHDSELRPALDGGKTVVQDRNWISTAIYQGDWRGPGAPEPRWPAPEFIARMHDWMPAPDLLVLIDVPARVAMARIRARSGQKLDQFDATPEPELEERRQRYLRLATDPGLTRGKAIVVDGNRTPEAVAEDIWGHVSASLVDAYGRQLEAIAHSTAPRDKTGQDA